MHSQNQTHPMVEPLEGRVLFATVDLSSAFGGSVLFARKDGSVNRVHAAIHVATEDSSGGIEGSVSLKGLGSFQFNGSFNNSLLFVVFSGANGSGNLVASATSDGALSGELAGTIGGVVTKGSIRLHSNGGMPASGTVTNQFANTTTSGSSGSFNQSAITGNFGGSVIFQGTPPIETTAGTARHRVHAVLNLSTNLATPNLLTGNFRMDHVGKYTVTGQTSGDQTVLIYTGGTGSGGMVLNTGGSLPGNNPLVPTGASTTGSSFSGGAVNLVGKLFGTIDAADVHANAAFHTSSALATTAGAPSLDFGGIASPVTPSILNNQATATNTTTNGANNLLTNPNTNTPSFINTGMTNITNMNNSSTSLVDSTGSMSSGGVNSFFG